MIIIKTRTDKFMTKIHFLSLFLLLFRTFQLQRSLSVYNGVTDNIIPECYFITGYFISMSTILYAMDQGFFYIRNASSTAAINIEIHRLIWNPEVAPLHS